MNELLPKRNSLKIYSNFFDFLVKKIYSRSKYK